MSSELDEVYALADRIAVMYRGRIMDVVSPDTSRDGPGSADGGGPERRWRVVSQGTDSGQDPLLDSRDRDTVTPPEEDESGTASARSCAARS